MKRTRRIEIVQYTRRVTLTDGAAAASAEYAARIGMPSTPPEAMPSTADDANRHPTGSEAPLPRRRRSWLDWLKRE